MSEPILEEPDVKSCSESSGLVSLPELTEFVLEDLDEQVESVLLDLFSGKSNSKTRSGIVIPLETSDKLNTSWKSSLLTDEISSLITLLPMFIFFL